MICTHAGRTHLAARVLTRSPILPLHAALLCGASCWSERLWGHGQRL